MAAARNTTNPSTQPTPAIDRERPTMPAGRRRMFALAAGAAALAATATAGATEAEPLEALWQEYQRVDDLHTKACVAHGEAEDLAYEAHPPRPACLYGKRYGTDVLFEMTEANIIHWRDQCTRLGIRGGEFHERQLRELYAWRAACAEIDAAHGLDRLDDEAQALGFKLDALIDQIVETPPQTLRGVLIKLLLADQLAGYTADCGDTIVSTLIVRLIDDLKAATVGGAS